MPILIRAIVQSGLQLAIVALCLFGAAGDWRWPAAWTFIVELAVSSALVVAWLFRRYPDLLRDRLSSPIHRGQAGWDRSVLVVLFAAVFGWLAMLGVDARRYAWSHVPVALSGLGALLIAACMLLYAWTLAHNHFAVPQVRAQADRGHRVVTSGPYAFVRHPMYASALIFFVGAALMLGSWIGVAFVPIFAVMFGVRASGEERLLRRELTGYDAYAKQVRSRLIPGIW